MVAGIWVSTSHIPDLGVAAFVGDGEGLRELHIGSSVTSAVDLIGQENRDAAERVSESARVVSGYSVRDIIDAWRSGEDLSDLALRPIGTPFQQMVWSGLKAIPRGQTQSYQAFASTIGRPTAVRAVASACANNRLGVTHTLPSRCALRWFSGGISMGARKEAATVSVGESLLGGIHRL